MAKQLNVNLAFTADTGKAKAQLQDLQNQLTRLMNTGVSTAGTFGITNSMIEASQAAATLKMNLQEAINVNTGKLDLGKFQQQMQQSGMSLQKYRDALVTLGPDGTQAFASLATSITQAEIPLRRSNALVAEMWTTLKNTARWQISSSILHGFMGTLQSAYGYAQDLNESLNNIRIVTGNNIDQMAKFAEQANKAAKALSTTTTEYTNASLIYYQQGLTDQEVQERTDVTIKMANAAGQSAEIVSDQMTAVWNNFDDGSKSLEYYADVMTALGAATASSTDEIAEGLEKFAAVAETVGLSYEYATASLATITATTRQSADIVGTALKTLFARIQGLSLGETLDDGTNLNKYSEALNKVGISIFEQNGQMKEMDKILDEMGQKWDTLDKSQQTALAQTVAGVRQYTQLIALMDNWDFFQQNLDTVANSAGTLDQQAQIYAESWAAAEKRVKASAQAIYDALLDDEFFIDLTDFSAEFLDTIKNTIDSLGGLKGVLLTVSSVITVLFRDQMAKGIENTIYNLRMMTEAGRQSVRQIRNEANKILTSTLDESTSQGDAMGKAYVQQGKLQQVYIDNAQKMDQAQQRIAQSLLDQQQIMIKNVEVSAQQTRQYEEQINASERLINNQITQAGGSSNIHGSAIISARNDVMEVAQAAGFLNTAIDNLNRNFKTIQTPEQLQKFKQEITTLNGVIKKSGYDIEAAFGVNAKRAFDQLVLSLDKAEINVDQVNREFDQLVASFQSAELTDDFIWELANALNAAGMETNQALRVAQQFGESYRNLGVSTYDLTLKQNNLVVYTNKVAQAMVELAQKNYTTGQAMMSLAGTISSVAMGISSIVGLVKTWNNEDISGAEKLLSTLTTLGFTLPLITKAFNAENLALLATVSNTIRAKQGLDLITVSQGKLALASKGAAAAIWGTIWPITAIVAAVAGLTIGIKELVEWYNREENAAKSAAEAANQAQEAFNDAKSALDDLNSSLDIFNSLAEKLNELTPNTKEWNEALKESNDLVLDLLRKYPELSKYFSIQGSQYTINSDELLKDQENRVNQAQSDLNFSKAVSSQSSMRSRRSALAKKADNYDITDYITTTGLMTVGMAGGGFKVGAVAGAGLGSGITATAGGIAGGVAGLIGGLSKSFNDNIIATEQSKAAIQQLEQAYLTEGEIVFSSVDAFNNAFTDVSQNTIDALWDEKESLEKLCTATDANTQQIVALIAANVSSVNADNEDFYKLTDHDKGLMSLIVGQRIQDDLNTDSAEYNAAREKWNKEIFNGLEADDYSAYLEARFGDEASNYQIVNAAGQAATLQKLNDDGTYDNVGEKNSLTNEAVLDYMASYELAKIQGDRDLSSLNAIQNIGDILSSAGLDQDQTYSIQSEIISGNGTSLIGLSPEDVGEIKAALETDSALLGSAYGEALQTAINAYEQDGGAEQYKNEKARQDAEYISSAFASASKELEISEAALESYADALIDANEPLEDNKVLAAKVAIEHVRLAKGLNKVQKIYKDNIDVLNEADESSMDYHEAIGELSEALTETFNMKVSPDFIKNADNLENIKKAADGDVEALRTLRSELNKDFIANLALNDTAKSDLITALDEMSAMAQDADIGTEITLNNTNALAAINEALITGQATIDDIEAMFNNANLQMPEYKTKTIPGDAVHSHSKSTYKGPLGITWDVESDTTTTTDRVVPYFGDNAPTVDNETGQITDYGGGTTITANASANDVTLDSALDYEDDDGSGSGGKDKENEGPPKTTVKRYKEIDDQLDNISKKMSKVNRESEQLYGAAKVSKMKENIQLMKKEVELLKQKEAEAKAYLALDKAALDKAAADAGIHFTYNDDGTIANYTEQMNIMQKRLEDAYAAAGSTISDSEQKLIDAISKHIEILNDAISDYDDSLNTMEEQADAVLESLDSIMRENYSVLTYELELKLEIDEAALQEIEFAINQLSDDFYKMAEIASLMIDQIDPYSNQLETLGDHFTALTDAYEDGKISQANYIDGLKETRDSIYDQLNALVDLDKEMMEYYGNTLDAAMEELDKYTDHMEHLTGVIDHYISLMELMGKSTDFEAMDEFLSARAETTKNELDVAKANYEMLARQKAQIEERMAGTREGSAEWELYKKEWDAIVATMDEAQDEMLSKTEEWMEAMKAVIENNMNKAAKSLEDALTNGMSFDHMMTELDRLNERQEEYLTKTNQVYETNKLMRAAAQAADKTDNAVAKQKFKNFSEETKQLQEKGQLSKYELEIQQAKYDLLLAEIALEDAQNAKSTVRLQRDSEGNFGYVYTADQDKISDAQQAVADAENDLYNISLNGQQEYTEKYTQALQSMYDEMKALQEAYLAGDIATDEEYQARKEALMNHYFGVPDGILTTYSSLYNVAVQTDASATADFWAKSYGDMTANTEAFKDAVNGYLVEVETETEVWHEITKTAQEDITEGLDDLVEESEEYADVVEDEVIPALEDELDAVEDLTAGYADQRAEVLRLIQTYKQLVQAINAAIAAAARQSGSSRSSTGDYSRDAAIAVTKGEDTSGILSDRAEEMETGNHPNAVDQDVLERIIEDAQDGNEDALKIIDGVANDGKKYTDYNLDKWSYGTGGYTGEWGPQAKLAFVHEKEIMLNPDDTVNFLSAIQITRSIMELIDKQAGWASAGLGIMSASGVQDYNQVLEQEVTIHAEFPNATNHNEIEEAFNNLMNTASQYANRKNR